MRIATRLYLDQPLHRTATPQLSLAQIHQLRTVLRLTPGDGLALFNAHDGEWAAKVECLTKRQARLSIHEQRRLPDLPGQADLWLLSAPVKRARIDLIVEKATELGATRFQPVITQLTAVTRMNLARLRAQAIEAAEQCERLHVPEIAEPVDLQRLLRDWPASRRLLLCDETGAQAGSARPLGDLAASLAGRPLALLIGPEGGFAPSELDLLRQLPFLSCVSLGPRILRADTAAIAALAIVQALAGDWRPTSAAR